MHKKLIILTTSFPLFENDVNGNFVFELTRRLLPSFEKITVISPSHPKYPDRDQFAGIQIFRFKQAFSKKINIAYGIGLVEKLKQKKAYFLLLPFFLLSQLIALIKINSKEKASIIHAHWLIPNGLIAVLYKKIFNKNIKVLITAHGSDIWGFDNIIGNWLKTFVLKNSDSISAVSSAIANRVNELGYTKNLHIISMGIDTEKFNPNKRSEKLRQQLQIKGVFLFFAGIVVEQKGIRHLIEAMPQILQKHPETKLVVAGDGNLREEMEQLAKHRNIENNVVFCGMLPHNELPEYFATADLFILPSFSEGWPVVVMEALSSGCSIAVSDIPVFSSDKQNKIYNIFKTNNTESLGEKVTEILDRNITESHRTENRDFAQNNFDWRIIAQKYKNLINTIIE